MTYEFIPQLRLRERLHLKSFLKDSNLKPIDCTAVDQRGKHSESVSESITDRTHT